MSKIEFAAAFEKLTGNRPFPWQVEMFNRFKAGQIDRSLDIPTGLGKTSVMAVWLLARADGAPLPRRLVYIVDRRAVVDQATDVADAIRVHVGSNPKLTNALGLGSRGLPVSTLRGQHIDNKEWLHDPASPAIIVGTIDMIGSRLLFEGYGVSRKMRPYHAGLLGADTLVVLDEAHLVPPFEMLLDAIATNGAHTCPCDAEAKAVVPQFKLMALSATGRTRSEKPFSLTDEDLEHPVVRQRLDAKKRLRLKLLKVDELAKRLARMAWIIAGRGKRAVRVIVFCDKRKEAEVAKKTLEQIAKAADEKDIKERTELFVGGRRVRERRDAAEQLKSLGFIAGLKTTLAKPAFVFATAAGEVGVDLDADHMVGDLVEWERMIQRLGRVNRRGEGDARVVVLVEPDPQPGKAAKAALATAPDERDKKEVKAIEDYQREIQIARAKRKPFDHLRCYDDGRTNASPGAIRDLKARADGDDALQTILNAATTAEPLRPALTRPIVDAWAMTSLKEHTGRPEISPWLRGWKQDDAPQTTVIWRTYLPIPNPDGVIRKENDEIEAFFEAASPHITEGLEAKTQEVLEWLLARAKALGKDACYGRPSSATDEKPILVFALSPAADLPCVLALEKLLFEDDDRRRNQNRKATLWKALAGATLVVDARFAGLHDGLLDPAENDTPPTADDGIAMYGALPWQQVVGFRVRATDADTREQRSVDPQWRMAHRFQAKPTEDGEQTAWLIVDEWRTESSTEEGRSVGNDQLLAHHQEMAEECARKLATGLNLPEQYSEMLATAARLHDEGKRAPRWQRAFNAPDAKVYAKTQGPINLALLDGYRHEFKSIEVAAKDTEFLKLPHELRELALHMIAAHHGNGRPVIGVSGCDDAPPSKLEARGREVTLRFARLQERWGPWGLAWWESLLRAVDQQASRQNEGRDAQRKREVAP